MLRWSNQTRRQVGKYSEKNADHVLGFDVSLMYTDTNIDGDPNGASEMIVLTVSRSF